MTFLQLCKLILHFIGAFEHFMPAVLIFLDVFLMHLRLQLNTFDVIYSAKILIYKRIFMEYKLCVPCLLGLEAPIADELKRLELNGVRSENGRVYFDGDERSIVRANINLRCGERILVELGSFEARTFEELFQGTKALPWERIIPKDAAFPVKGYSLNSALFSVSDCQKIIKKAIVERLKGV